jgi:hypothetical protein
VKLRRLNDAGIERFENFLDSLTIDATHPAPSDALADPSTSESIGIDLDVEPSEFASRLELGSYLVAKLDGVGLSRIDEDRGLWAWLSLFYFESVCPADRAGRRVPGSRVRWLLEPHNFQRYYRHLLAGPYRICRAYAGRLDLAMCLLCGPPDKPGDVVEQLASRQELVTNPAILGAATRLYFDPSTGRLKRGAGGKDRGSSRRLAEILAQFDVTYDLYSLSMDQMLALIPKEFDRFLKA